MPRSFINSSFTASWSEAGVEGWGAGSWLGLLSALALNLGFPFPQREEQAGVEFPSTEAKVSLSSLGPS